jgi:hypothetical protein
MSTKIIENATIGHEQISHLPMFGIQRFREFMIAPRVWGKEENSVHWDDVLIHIRDNGKIYTFSNENTGSTANPLDDNFLSHFSDKAIVYIESGYMEASKDSTKTRFVRVHSAFDSKEWSKDLADIVQAWDVDFYQDLKTNRAA